MSNLPTIQGGLMPKGPRQSRNPVEKLQAYGTQLENIFQAILESAEKPDFVSSIIALKKKIEDDTSNKTKLNKEAREVTKLLQTYPGLSKQILISLRSKISEYKALNVLEQYKTAIETQPKKRAGSKGKRSSESTEQGSEPK